MYACVCVWCACVFGECLVSVWCVLGECLVCACSVFGVCSVNV